MKRRLSFVLAGLLCCVFFAGCTSPASTPTSTNQKTIADFDADAFVNNEYFGKTASELEELGFTQSGNSYRKIVDAPFSDQTYIMCMLSESGAVDDVGYVWKNSSLDDAIDQSLVIKETIDAQAKELLSVSQDDKEITFDKNTILQATQNSDSSILCIWAVYNPADLVYSIQKTEEGATCILMTSDRSVSPSPTPSTIVYDAELGSGHYTAGIDFPAGTYNLTAVKGGGNVSSDNAYSGGINAIMGVEDDDFYQKEYANISLPYGTQLSINGVVLQIHSEAASGAPLTPREQPNTEEVKLGNGNFVAGTDFPAGVYNVVAVSGGGNVSSDNIYSGGLNAIMGTKNDDFYIKEYKNIEFPSGTTLTIDGVKIKLVPSK